MLSDAIKAIQEASASEAGRRRQALAKRELMHQVDGWLDRAERLLEEDVTTTPAPFLAEVDTFLAGVSPRLKLALDQDPAPVHVLDALFQVQEELQADHRPPRASRA